MFLISALVLIPVLAAGWMRGYGSENVDIGTSVRQTTDGGYIIVGGSADPETYYGDLYLVKTDSLGYVGVAEPVTHLDWEVISPIGHQITLRYSDLPQGFSASVFDTSGRKVDELHSDLTSGTLEWGEGISPGVYFIREESETSPSVQKVILIE